MVTRVAPSPLYERRGADLVLEVPVTYPEAALGATVEVPTPDGKVSLKVPAGSQDGKLLRLKGRGAPKLNGGGKGDLLARVRVTVPTKLTKAESEALEELQKVSKENPREAFASMKRARQRSPSDRGARPSSRPVRARFAQVAARRAPDWRDSCWVLLVAGPLGPRGRGGRAARRRRERRGMPERGALHDLRRRRARRHAPADAADVRGEGARAARSAPPAGRGSTPSTTSSGCG